mgnify:FL=1
MDKLVTGSSPIQAGYKQLIQLAGYFSYTKLFNGSSPLLLINIAFYPHNKPTFKEP